jgi:DNA-directed RNA polymerase subunit RPC12/RpoP
MEQSSYYCHDCDEPFEAAIDNQWGTYEFVRCPTCEGARTTLDGDSNV